VLEVLLDLELKFLLWFYS